MKTIRIVSGIVVFAAVVSLIALSSDVNIVKDNKSDLNCECDTPALPFIKFIEREDSVLTFEVDTVKKFVCKEPCKPDEVNNAITYKWIIQKARDDHGNASIIGNDTGTTVNVKLFKKGVILLRLTVEWICTDQDNKGYPCSVTDVISLNKTNY